MAAPGDQKSRAGFVLAGGRSSRMGRDKALLPLDGRTLIDRVAGLVQRAAGNVTLIAPEGRYMGYPVIPDLIANQGPLGGLYTALSATKASWNLLVACDMPGVTLEFLENLFARRRIERRRLHHPAIRRRTRPFVRRLPPPLPRGRNFVD